jgi:hypothetical protein
MHHSARLVPLIAVVLLTGCEMLGAGSAEKLAAAKDAEGRAIGGACRHAGRAIEDCYGMNRKADKAAIFAGWREMNDYMRENKLEAVVPQGVSTAKAEAPTASGGKDKDRHDESPADEAKGDEAKADEPASKQASDKAGTDKSASDKPTKSAASPKSKGAKPHES